MGNIAYACEEQIVDYLTASLPASLTASLGVNQVTFVTGIGNTENLQAPLVVVSAVDSNEVYYQSNVYELFVTVGVYEMAADTQSGSLGVLAHYVQNCFWNQNPQQNTLETALNVTGSHNFVTYQCQCQNIKHSKEQDALINEMTLRLVGTISGSVSF